MWIKSYLAAIAIIQEALLWIGVAMLVILPVILAYVPEAIPAGGVNALFAISLGTVFFVMCIRPLADLLPTIPWVRPLVILRKGFGVVSAAIIVSFMLSKVLLYGLEYFATFFTAERWSIASGAILSPVGDISAVILLLTSNKFSKRVLGKNWKRIQKLSYVYFYSGALYEYVVLEQQYVFWYLLVVTGVVILAFLVNRFTRTAV